MTRRLFGTDGIRGVAGEHLSASLALELARAATALFATRAPGRPQVLLLRDTRESGEMLEAAMAAGISSAGGDALLAGVLPTPAAPLLIARHGFDMAAVISASHNPFEDNGIKLFGPDGGKLGDATELEIERLLGEPPASARDIGRVRRVHGMLEDYLRALHARFAALDLSGRRIVLDCANGATYEAAPAIFRRLGAEPEVLNATPDGRNINAGCGSTHVDELAAVLAERGGYDVAFAFDGDGDRVLAVDPAGAVVDGDELIARSALHMRAEGRLPGDGVAVTVMTNYGFHVAMKDAGIDVATTQVGDRYVLEALRERGWMLGGEQSGHIIDMGFVPSGDGIASALLTLEALGSDDLGERIVTPLPQTLVNVRVKDRDGVAGDAAGRRAFEREAKALEGRGRVLIRPSGTEPVVRVMVEAPSADEARQVTERLVAVVEAAAGAAAPR